ncbi:MULTISPECIES: PKD domain-containing protein [unclassified Brachybacterium]|uniref:PKD domain-containing protein n=1 Tax=unclassified Brachybacterium TaxID=2623841 RepID=UPI0036164FEF
MLTANRHIHRKHNLVTIFLAAIILFSAPLSAEADDPPVEGKLTPEEIAASLEDATTDSGESTDSSSTTNDSSDGNAPKYSYVWEAVSAFDDCEMSADAAWQCDPDAASCESDSAPMRGNGDVMYNSSGGGGGGDTDSEGVTQRGTRIDNETGEETDMGFRCAMPGSPEMAEAEPIVITVTQSDFAQMPVDPLKPHAGPVDGWLPVNMVNVLYAEAESQELEVTLLDTPVAVRATPVSYHWDLGDGNTITTDNPGEPYPSEAVSSTYTQEGWYDITLTTTFTGQFSVNGGEWQDIEGSIEIESESVPVYSKSLESRLVNGNVPVDEEEDPWIPGRTTDTEGPKDPSATHRTI